MRPVAGRRVWKAGFGKFLFRHKVLHKMQMAVRSTRAETFWILPIYIQFRAGKRPAYWECVLTLRPNSLHLLHRPAGSLWAARSRNSYQVWRPHFQTWRCRSKTAETPERNAKREFIIERLKSIFVSSFLLEVWQERVLSGVCLPGICWLFSCSASWSESSPVWCGWACEWAAGCAPGGPGRWACGPAEDAFKTP